jgi:uncharacterized protein (TIGR03067 family)
MKLKRERLLAMAVVFAALATAGGADDAKSELKKFQGSWSLTGVEQNGIAGNKDQLAEVKWVQDGDKLTIKIGTSMKEATISLDPSKDPKAIDMLVTAGPGKGETSKGIYKFIDDELVLCFPQDYKGSRPKEFTAKAGSEQVLNTLKRKKE